MTRRLGLPILFATTLALAVIVTGAILSSPRARTPLSALDTCINSDCPIGASGLGFHGGPVISAPQVYLVRFSDSGTNVTPGGFAPGLFAADGLPGVIKTVVSSPSYTWWMREYSTPSDPINPGAYAGVITFADAHLADATTISEDDIVNFLQTQLNSGSLDASHTVYVVVTRATQHVTGMDSDACANHTSLLTASNQYVPVVVIPDWSATPGACRATGSTSTIDNMGFSVSHEVIESITDPNGSDGWRTTLTYNELVDICNYGPHVSNPVTYQGVTHQLALIYSAQAHACLSAPLPATLSATFTSPSQLRVTLRVRAPFRSHQRVQLSYGTITLATATTDAAGRAFVHISPLPTGTVVTLRLIPGPVSSRTLTLHAPVTHAATTLPTTTTTTSTTTTTATP